MSKTATLFLCDVTCIDHAYIDKDGRIKGGSYLPSFLVTGPVSEGEEVVVDFASLKKEIKALIDDREKGFDHKLWVIEGFSQLESKILNEMWRMSSSFLNMTLPLNAVKFFKSGDYTNHLIGKAIEDYLNLQLRQKYPEVSVKCINSSRAQTVEQHQPYLGFFNYVHGLKNSSSWGCQSLAHGHKSFIQFSQPFCSKSQELSVANQLASIYNDAVFISEANIVRNNTKTLSIGYETERGLFSATYDKNLCKLIILKTETTVEYLIADLVKRGKELIEQVNASGLYLSEGLTKGAYLSLK